VDVTKQQDGVLRAYDLPFSVSRRTFVLNKICRNRLMLPTENISANVSRLASLVVQRRQPLRQQFPEQFVLNSAANLSAKPVRRNTSVCSECKLWLVKYRSNPWN
jgi:hypothetical protein